jgi:predicted GIY-YIG superfamily endonuclease
MINEYNCYTSSRLPITVELVQPFGTRDEALAAERQIKKWIRKKKEALIEGNWTKISALAKKKFS